MKQTSNFPSFPCNVMSELLNCYSLVRGIGVARRGVGGAHPRRPGRISPVRRQAPQFSLSGDGGVVGASQAGHSVEYAMSLEGDTREAINPKVKLMTARFMSPLVGGSGPSPAMPSFKIPSSSELVDVLPFLARLALVDSQLVWRMLFAQGLVVISKAAGLMAPLVRVSELSLAHSSYLPLIIRAPSSFVLSTSSRPSTLSRCRRQRR